MTYQELVSIPFDQGNVFRLWFNSLEEALNCVSIPFDQGNVFRRIEIEIDGKPTLSQSLSIRAMSFDY